MALHQGKCKSNSLPLSEQSTRGTWKYVTCMPMSYSFFFFPQCQGQIVFLAYLFKVFMILMGAEVPLILVSRAETEKKILKTFINIFD